MVILMKCLRCKSSVILPIDVKKLERCSSCKEKVFLQYYEHAYSDEITKRKEIENDIDILKGGDTMTEKKNTTEKKILAEKPAKKVGIVEQRKEFARKVLDYMKTELKVEDVETSKVLSRANYIHRGV